MINILKEYQRYRLRICNQIFMLFSINIFFYLVKRQLQKLETEKLNKSNKNKKIIYNKMCITKLKFLIFSVL